MKNICFFNSSSSWQGNEKQNYEYALKFKSKKYRVFIFSAYSSPLYQKSKEVKLKTEGFKIRSLSYLNPYILFKLFTFFKRNRIDVVFFSRSQDVKAGGIAAKIAGVPKIAYLRGVAVPMKRLFINRLVLKSITTHIIANSEETARMVLKNYSSVIPEYKVKVIYNGIDLKEFDNHKYQEVITRRDDEIVIGTAGRLTKIKGQNFLIDIAARLKQEGVNFKFYIAGAGEFEPELKELCNRYKLQDYIVFQGFAHDVKSFLMDIDIFVFPSLSEGLGFAIVEAMAAAKPVVAFDISPNPEIVKDGQTGFLIPFPDTAGFKEKLMLLIQDKQLRIEMGKKGRIRVEKSFNVDQKISEIENVVMKTR
jgi:glycosyltransferase involved in cell wall biosynthesis